jgi:hypothetical protein
MPRTKSYLYSQGIVKWGTNLYCYTNVDWDPWTTTTIYRTPTYTVGGDEAMEAVQRVTITATVGDGKFVGGGGKLYLWDSVRTPRRVITFDCATMAVTKTDDYGFDITDIDCDDDAYYISQNGDATTDEPLHVHRVTIAGAVTTYDGVLSTDGYAVHEHYAEYIRVIGGKILLSCSANPAGSSPWTYGQVSEITIATMTRNSVATLFNYGPSSIYFGFSDWVTDGTYAYGLFGGNGLRKFTLGAIDTYVAESGSHLVSVYTSGHGMLYLDGIVYRTITDNIIAYNAGTLAHTITASTSTLYRSVQDGTHMWQDWRWFERVLSRSTLPSFAVDEKLFEWIGSDGNAVWYMGI